MLIRKIDVDETKPVDMSGVKDVNMRILLGRSDGAPTFAIRHFVVKKDGNTPLHQHNYEHGVFIVAGSGTVAVGDESQEIISGDTIFIPANIIHQFKADRGNSLQFLCMVPTVFDCDKPTPGS